MRILGFKWHAWFVGGYRPINRPTFDSNESLRFAQLAARKRLEREGRPIDRRNEFPFDRMPIG